METGIEKGYTGSPFPTSIEFDTIGNENGNENGNSTGNENGNDTIGNESITVEQFPTIKRGRGRPRKVDSENTQKEAKVKKVTSKTNYIQQAEMLINICNGMIISTMGMDSALNETEIGIIKEPLGRTLERYSPDEVAALGKWLDPLMIIAGIGMWLVRTNKPKNNDKKKEVKEEVKQKVNKDGNPYGYDEQKEKLSRQWTA